MTNRAAFCCRLLATLGLASMLTGCDPISLTGQSGAASQGKGAGKGN